MIIPLNGKRKRLEQFQTYKLRGAPEYRLVLKLYKKYGVFSGAPRYLAIDLATGCGLSWYPGSMVTAKGEPLSFREVAFSQLPEEVAEMVCFRVERILEHGDPWENDTHIYDDPKNHECKCGETAVGKHFGEWTCEEHMQPKSSDKGFEGNRLR